MFQKVFEYAGPHKKGLYAATAIVLVSVLMGVLPFVLAYQVWKLSRYSIRMRIPMSGSAKMYQITETTRWHGIRRRGRGWQFTAVCFHAPLF